MIISHKHQFIFLKTKKTAGTSVEIALSKFCGPDDIITPISPNDEEKRRLLGYRGAQNYKPDSCGGGVRGLLGTLLKKSPKDFSSHIKARTVKPFIDDQVWDGYYKFCYERNPWDRVVSLYYWNYKAEPRPTMMEFLNSKRMMTLHRKGWGVYTINEKVVVDKICKFENLAEELEVVRKHLGIPEPLELPRTKSGSRKDKRSYREVFTEEEKEKIAELFADEIKLMGYEF